METVWGDDAAHDKEAQAVEAQAEAANKAGSWHYLVITSDREAILQLVRDDPEAIHSRGPVGETILHFLLLLCVMFLSRYCLLDVSDHILFHTQHTFIHTQK